jgi:glycosyltransferase involved in cell wall biosynthesis
VHARPAGAADAPGFTTQVPIEVGLLTGGIDKPYAFGLAMALVSRSVSVDFIGSDEVDSPALHGHPNLTFFNLRGDQRSDASLVIKIRRILIYYARLIRYAAAAKPRLFHILWNNKFEKFDRTMLMLYYKLQAKKIALTAHNVNAGKRDGNDSLLNRLTLRIQYRLADHIFVHTERMKAELLKDFGVRAQAVTVIPLGFNNSSPNTSLTSVEARALLDVRDGERTILFFGGIGPYKGLEHLVAAFQRVATLDPLCKLFIVGRPKAGDEKYWDRIRETIRRHPSRDRIIQRIEFVPDEETERYFKAADVLALPYTDVCQSGVLVLGYSFGLPVIATDVGSLSDDIVEGSTGFLCKPGDPADLARTIQRYFESELFRKLHKERPRIRDYAARRHSWDLVSERTLQAYAELLPVLPLNRSGRK